MTDPTVLAVEKLEVQFLMLAVKKAQMNLCNHTNDLNQCHQTLGRKYLI